MTAVFEDAFRRLEAGRPATITVRDVTFEPALWCRDDLPGDSVLRDACTGPTLDVGCGPGRLTVALARAGRPALGIDVSAAAVRMARRRGASALLRDVFDPLPGAGRWEHLLLADGNIGIGGDPVRLLRRCRALLGPSGLLHAELAPPGTPTWSGTAIARSGAGATTISWAAVPIDDLSGPATAAGLRVLHTRTEAGRWFATLTRR
ncbi:methyltransferase domain-containing protein [Catenuloplanes japonicus]|uniref:methyltransferase domain-containing protein n=1 Tax=Catenuloplanes japonicus TaxID=33876 RepID=UPI000527A7CA|nr:class I SAM-dependent methyltransferase [Catenuloplanes japonicus]